MMGLSTYNIYFGLGIDKYLFLVQDAMDDMWVQCGGCGFWVEESAYEGNIIHQQDGTLLLLPTEKLSINKWINGFS